MLRIDPTEKEISLKSLNKDLKEVRVKYLDIWGRETKIEGIISETCKYLLIFKTNTVNYTYIGGVILFCKFAKYHTPILILY